MIAAQLGREEVAELLLNKRASTDGGEKTKKTNKFWWGFREIQEKLISREQDRSFRASKKVFSFYFVRFGNLEDAFRSLAICNKSNVLLVLLSALSCLRYTDEGVFLRRFVGLFN